MRPVKSVVEFYTTKNFHSLCLIKIEEDLMSIENNVL